jgi:hypothetical protein
MLPAGLYFHVTQLWGVGQQEQPMNSITQVICAIVSLSALTGCGLVKDQRLTEAYNSAEAAEQECDTMKKNNAFKKWKEVSRCYEENVWPIYQNANYPNIDLIQLGFAKYYVIHERMDAKKITTNEGVSLKREVKAEINNKIYQRAAIEAQAQAAQASTPNFGQALGDAFKGLTYRQPIQTTPTYTLPAPSYIAPARPMQTNCTVTPGNSMFPQSQVDCRSY